MATTPGQTVTSQERDTKGKFAAKYDAAVMWRVCERVSEGETLAAICAEEGMPDRKTIRRAIMKDERLRKAYDAARELQAHSLFEEALEIGRKLSKGTHENADVNAKRVAIDTLKWGASKLLPREYGERADGHGVINIQINTGLDLGRASGAPQAGLNLYSLQASIEVPLVAADADNQRASGPSAPALTDARPPQHPFAALTNAKGSQVRGKVLSQPRGGAGSQEGGDGENDVSRGGE